MKKVSIVLPVYNGENFLASAIESVLGQTYTELELIIVDDRSKDGTPAIIKEYAARDARIKPFRNKKNRKLPRSLNIGFLHATGEYRTWTSHDNLYDPEAIEKMVNALEEHPECSLVCADLRTVDIDGNPAGEVRLRPPEDIFIKNTVGACFLYRTSEAKRIGGYDTDLFLAEDYDYWIRLRKTAPFLHLDECLYTVRVHDGSLSSQKAKESNKAYVRMMKKHFKYMYDRIETVEGRDELVNEMMNRSTTFGMKLSSVSRICSRRGDYWLRVLHGWGLNVLARLRGG